MADNFKLQYETSQTPVGNEEMSDSGDQKTFTTANSPWSRFDDKDYEVRPNGIVTGLEGSVAASGSDDVVDVAAGTVYQGYTKYSISAATDVAVTRGTTDAYLITSITVDNTQSITAVAGTEGTAFSETRGTAGGPPYIPDGSIELFQVRLDATASAAVTDDEIYDTIGTHRETYDYPGWEEDAANGEITFDSALPKSHTSDNPKNVWINYNTPVFVDAKKASGFAPAEKSYSVSTTEYYNDKSTNTISESIGQGSFTAELNDGVSDDLRKKAGFKVWVKFFPDKNKSPYILTNGTLGMSRSFPVGGKPSAEFTVNAEEESINIIS